MSSNNIFDSHIHLSSLSKRYEFPYKNISYCLNVCTNINEYKNRDISDRIYTSLATTPQDCKCNLDEHGKTLSFLSSILQSNKKNVDAIGETGLDGPFLSEKDQQNQISAFQDYYSLAEKYNKPLIIHCRNEFPLLIKLLRHKKKRSRPGIIHCFTGTTEEAKSLIEMNWKISISGILTFKKSDTMRKTVQDLDIKDLLVETDAPYLAPVPHRGRENSPEYINYTVNKISEIKNINFEEVVKITRENAENVFDASI